MRPVTVYGPRSIPFVVEIVALLERCHPRFDWECIADEVIADLAGLVGATVTVTLEIEAEVPAGAPDHVVRTVTENGRTLKFTSQGFERE